MYVSSGKAHILNVNRLLVDTSEANQDHVDKAEVWSYHHSVLQNHSALSKQDSGKSLLLRNAAA
jgi:hypothetical protein